MIVAKVHVLLMQNGKELTRHMQDLVVHIYSNIETCFIHDTIRIMNNFYTKTEDE